MPARPPGTRALGEAGETLVARHYEASGFEVLDRNWRSPAGELDLVLRRGRLVVFCEVKTRAGIGFGVPAEAVDARKQARIRRLASAWLAEHRRRGETRFDVASVVWPKGGQPTVEVIEAAF
ncbi:MAG TPA: YraN family protein [Acidimicrobiia bacterium]|nr:YraN family protein [Acidimicrobiia bacterium]